MSDTTKAPPKRTRGRPSSGMGLTVYVPHDKVEEVLTLLGRPLRTGKPRRKPKE